MKPLQPIAWTDPLELAAGVADEYCVLLYSGTRASYSGRFSYLAYGLNEIIHSDDFSAVASRLTIDKPWHENAWFGYLGYGLKNTLEKLSPDTSSSIISLPDLTMMRFNTLIRFDHDKKIVEGWSNDSDALPAKKASIGAIPTVKTFHSNMTNNSYRQKAEHIIASIHAGDLYQANLTRKFYGEFARSVDSFALFKDLCEQSPAPYSAYIRMKDHAICSSSPELFLRISADGHVETRPIKGTSPRKADPAEDKISFDLLAGSSKDKAENLMITDLMRNDLARTCAPGSISVHDMFSVTSHSNVHHMASTVTGVKTPEVTTIDIVKNCFPPGSMTGAPKIKAMELCTQLENMARGVYSGAIGLFDGAGGAELSVVIRTIITHGKLFEFQVGGGIIADSTPEGEMQETFDKAKGILNTLKIAPEALRTL